MARSVVDFVCEQLDAGDESATASETRVASVHLRIGVMAGVVPQALRSAFRASAIGTQLEGAELHIETVDLVVWCPQCKQEQLLENTRQLRCPVCSTRTPRIMQGRELEIASIEVIDAATAANRTSSTANP
jgi:hydrogenase nickel incorporation protein HypA/HybF